MTDQTSITEPATVREEDQPPKPDRPRWPELHVGERVTLTMVVTVGHPADNDTAMFYIDAKSDPASRGCSVYVPRYHPDVQVSRGTPAEGEPEVGELWTDERGVRLFPYENDDGDDETTVWLIDEYGHAMPWEQRHRSQALGPIRRLMTADDIASWR